MADETVIAYVALGSNLGNRDQNLREALTRLNEIPGIRVTCVSSFLDNPAVGGPEHSPPFLNAIAEVQTRLPAAQLLESLLNVEQKLGRERREKWGPRTIDLDLILYGDQIIKSPGLAVPHPLMHERRFVLGPLAKIAPNREHPVLKQSIQQLLDGLQP